MSRLSRNIRWTARAMAALAVVLTLVGCGEDVKGADLFLLTRRPSGHRNGPQLSLLVNDSGTISCNGGRPKPLADPLLLQARDLASSLNGEAGLRLLTPPNSVFHYYIVLPYGSVSFPDTAAVHHPLLAQVLQFELKASRQACGLKG
jgi:predicted small lipoprotein YifL